ncbi:MAG: alpha/beta hydrolase [Rhodobacteraceae bacterium]|jgi:hypothetical protein|nr:alpha/beta hydrolase [Paracoccaceae bacterium]
MIAPSEQSAAFLDVPRHGPLSGTLWDVPYRTASVQGERITLEVDLFLPETPARQAGAMLVWFHSGAFCTGTRKRPAHRMLARWLNAVGMSVAVPSYRLGSHETDLDPTLRAALPDLLAQCPPTFRPEMAGPWALAALADSVALLHWLDAQRAALGIAGRLVVGGTSAGAINALNLLHAAPGLGLKTPELGGGFCYSGAFAYPDLFRPGRAPVFAMHSPHDRRVDIKPIRALAARDSLIELIEAPGQTHGGFTIHPGEKPRDSFARILSRMGPMSGLA